MFGVKYAAELKNGGIYLYRVNGRGGTAQCLQAPVRQPLARPVQPLVTDDTECIGMPGECLLSRGADGASSGFIENCLRGGIDPVDQDQFGRVHGIVPGR